MAKYGTKQYWKKQAEQDTVKLELMVNGFAHTIVESQSVSQEDVISMIEQLYNAASTVSFDNAQYEEAEEEDDESQQ